MQMPDVTPVQKLVGAFLAVLSTALTLLTAFGVNLTAEQITAILGCASSVGSMLVIADAVIRHGRSRALANPEAMRELERPAAPVYND